MSDIRLIGKTKGSHDLVFIEDHERYDFCVKHDNSGGYYSHFASFYISFILSDSEKKQLEEDLLNMQKEDYSMLRNTSVKNRFDTIKFEFYQTLRKKNIPATAALNIASALKDFEDYNSYYSDFVKLKAPLRMSSETYISNLEIYSYIRGIFNREIADTLINMYSAHFTKLIEIFKRVRESEEVISSIESRDKIHPMLFEALLILTESVNHQGRKEISAISKILEKASLASFRDISKTYDKYLKETERSSESTRYKIRRLFLEGYANSAVALITSIVHNIYTEDNIRKALEALNNSRDTDQRTLPNFIIILNHYEETGDYETPLNWILIINDEDYDDSEEDVSDFF